MTEHWERVLHVQNIVNLYLIYILYAVVGAAAIVNPIHVLSLFFIALTIMCCSILCASIPICVLVVDHSL